MAQLGMLGGGFLGSGGTGAGPNLMVPAVKLPSGKFAAVQSVPLSLIQQEAEEEEMDTPAEGAAP